MFCNGINYSNEREELGHRKEIFFFLHTLILNKFFLLSITQSIKPPGLQKKNKRSYCFITHNAAERALIYSVECISLKKTPPGNCLKGKGGTWVNGKRQGFNYSAWSTHPWWALHSTTQPGKFIPAVTHRGFKAGRLVFMACCKINNISSFSTQVDRGASLEKILLENQKPPSDFI